MAALQEKIEPGILLLTLNRPEVKNAWNSEQYDDMTARLRAAAADDDVAAVVVTGSGNYFTSGADLADATPMEGAVETFMQTVIAFPKPLVAAVNGPAIGIGVTLLPHCDLAVCAEGATFWTPFARSALVPEFCSTVLFPRALGPALAGDLLLRSRKLTADEARAGGLVSAVLPAGDAFLPAALEYVRAMTAVPLARTTLALYKGMIRTPAVVAELAEVCTAELAELRRRFEAGEPMEAMAATFGSKL